MLNFIEKKPKNKNNDTYLVIFLHGYGSDANDLMSLSNEFSDEFNNIHYISAEAPFLCEAGFGYQWFSLQDITPSAIISSITNNYKILEDFIEEQSKRLQINYDHIFLLGFSQGAMMSLFAGIRLKSKLAGIIALSGLLAETVESMDKNLKTKQKILMIHGSSDQVVPYKYFLDSKEIFEKYNFDITSKTIYGMEHSINEEVIDLIKTFLHSIINN